jgi:DNA polymerase
MSLILDFESKSAANLPKVGADNYSKHPSTDALCVGFAMGDGPVDLLVPGDFEFAPFLDYVAAGGIVEAWNVPFELAMWNNVMVRRYGWPVLPPEQCVCLMAQSYAMAMPGSLENAAPAFGIDHRKDMAGNRIMMQLSQPREILPNGDIVWWTEEEFPEKFQALYAYCKKDVVVEREIKKRAVPLSASELKVWQMDYRINQRGIQIDREAVAAALELVTTEKGRLNERIREVSNNAIATCTAVKQITDYLKIRGCNVPDGIAKEAAKDILKDPATPPDCKEVLILRQEAGKSSTAKLESMLGRAGVDHRLRGMFQYHGATTGRWAGRGPQPQNLPRSSLPQSSIDAVFGLLHTEGAQAGPTIDMLYGPPLSVLSECLRGFFVAREGHEFVGADFSNIEGRVLAWLAGEDWKCRAFEAYDRGELPDIYIQGYSRSFGIPLSAVTDFQRQVGKVMELALGFGGGKGAFQQMAKGYGVRMKDAQAEEIKVAWREVHPATVNFWRELEEAALAAILNPGSIFAAGAEGRRIKFRMVGSFLWCRLPSGRALCYPYPKVELVETPWGALKDGVTYMSMNSLTNEWERTKTYGGSFAENVTQATASCLLRDAMLRIDSPEIPVVLHVHDDICTEPRRGTITVKEFEKRMAERPPWATGLPIAAKGYARARYGK